MKPLNSELRAEMIRLLEPHWRTDCSESEPHAYVRWVRCRCGWESRRSSSLVNAPDLHRIWIGHLVDALGLAAVTPPSRTAVTPMSEKEVREVRQSLINDSEVQS